MSQGDKAHVRPANWPLAALMAGSIALGGCIAPIREIRLDGPARPEADTRTEVTTERRAGSDGTPECRDIARTAPMVRDVDVRRSFADEAQERNGALLTLLGAGVGALVFSQDQWQCSGGACSAPTVSAGIVSAVAAIPLAFLVYNAVAVRDRRVVEPIEPEVRTGAWRACAGPQRP